MDNIIFKFQFLDQFGILQFHHLFIFQDGFLYLHPSQKTPTSESLALNISLNVGKLRMYSKSSSVP